LIRFLIRLFLFLFVISLSILIYKKNYLFTKLDNVILTFSVYTGNVLKEVYVSGRINENKSNITEALNVKIGDSLFNINLNEIRNNLNKLSWVQDSKIYILPLGKLEIEIFEYIPFGKYIDKKKKYFLINNDGIKFKEIGLNEYSSLFKLRGEGALLKINELSLIINKLKSFNLEVIDIERIDSRRWNIYLKKGYFIKLPHLDSINSLDALYELDSNIKYDNLIFIDLRIKNRISVKYKNID